MLKFSMGIPIVQTIFSRPKTKVKQTNTKEQKGGGYAPGLIPFPKINRNGHYSGNKKGGYSSI